MMRKIVTVIVTVFLLACAGDLGVQTTETFYRPDGTIERTVETCKGINYAGGDATACGVRGGQGSVGLFVLIGKAFEALRSLVGGTTVVVSGRDDA